MHVPKSPHQMEEGEANRDVEVAPALIAIHPSQSSVVVAAGSDLRVYDLAGNRPVTLGDDPGWLHHSDSIRAIRFAPKGELFVSAGDDKRVNVWSVDSWRCIGSVCCEKRVSAVAISPDGLYVCFADKFGVVWVVGVEKDDSDQWLVKDKPTSMLAHYCSIITSLAFSPDGRFIVSADRDSKIRVSVVPKDPLKGAHEIQSFCLGHSEFVSCLDFVCTPEYIHGLLVTGSGDSTVRLWDCETGSLLNTCEVGAKKVNDSAPNGTEGEPHHAVTDLCASPNRTCIAVAVQSLSGIVLLNCNLPGKTLSISRIVRITGEAFIPTSLGTGFGRSHLWMVAGISKLNGLDSSPIVLVRTMTGFSSHKDQEATILPNDEIPCSLKLLEHLQGSLPVESHAILAAADACRLAMCDLLVKKQYTAEKREFRKRTRNDKKVAESQQ